MKILPALGFVLALTTSAAIAGEVYFEDDFDGDAFAENWSVVNESDDAYLAEGGILTMLAKDGIKATFGTASNVLRLNRPVPAGDWTMTARFTMAPQTMGENFRIGLSGDADNGLYASYYMYAYNYNLTQVYAGGEKLAKGTSTYFSRQVFSFEDGDLEVRSGIYTSQIAAVEVRLVKSGRQYKAGVRMEPVQPGADGAPSGEWLDVQDLTSLKPAGDAFTIIFGSASSGYSPDGGESLIEIDWVKIETN